MTAIGSERRCEVQAHTTTSTVGCSTPEPSGLPSGPPSGPPSGWCDPLTAAPPKNGGEPSEIPLPTSVQPAREEAETQAICPPRRPPPVLGMDRSDSEEESPEADDVYGVKAITTRRLTAMQTGVEYRLREQAYREAFYILDDDFSGLLERSEINSFGQFMLGKDWSEDLLDKFIETADLDGSGGLSLQEFCFFCETTIVDGAGGSELDYVKDMVQGFISVTKTRHTMIKAKWQGRALKIDKFCQFWVPVFAISTNIAIVVWTLQQMMMAQDERVELGLAK